MSAFRDISIALNQRVQTYAVAASRDVAYENISYIPTTGKPFIRPTVLPVDTTQAGLGKNGQELHEGIFQIDVFYPVDTPNALVLDEADAIANHFARGLTLTYNGVNVRIGTTSVGSGNRENVWYQIPVSINYHSFTHARPTP
ncbi:MAG: phage tail terminator-like protein [Gammaproteobacteria bacterium]|nr:phage tail terminator-like protein [Gammaproteobacteria bacterium]